MTSPGRPLLLATTNGGKLCELAGILGSLPVTLVSLADLPHVPEPPENGQTFEENAREKALYYAARTGLITVADDSGLEVDALDGRPGVWSARVPGATYREKFQELYRQLDERGTPTSRARFVCALAVATGARVVFETRGSVEGELVREPAGHGGFGYDPIFYYPPLARTLAQLSAEEKTRVSHRGHAGRSLAAFIAAGGLGANSVALGS